MLRWKLFIPLALVLTGLGLLGNFYWSASASSRSLSTLNNQEVASIAIEGEKLIISFISDQALATILEELDSSQISQMSANRKLLLHRRDYQLIDAELTQKIELIMVQATSTHEYYEASKHLKDIADLWGYEAHMFIWQGRIVAEVGNSKYSYITQHSLKEVSP